MNGNISVVYEKGALRPLIPLNLPEKTRLEIHIVKRSPDEMPEREKAYQVLLQAGLLTPSEDVSGKRVSENERQKASEAYGKIGPLSELIIADRDE